MENQSLSHVDGYNLSIRNLAHNFYHLNIVDPEDKVYHFEGIYPSPQAAIDKGKSVIDNFVFWRTKAGH